MVRIDVNCFVLLIEVDVKLWWMEQRREYKIKHKLNEKLNKFMNYQESQLKCKCVN